MYFAAIARISWRRHSHCSFVVTFVPSKNVNGSGSFLFTGRLLASGKFGRVHFPVEVEPPALPVAPPELPVAPPEFPVAPPELAALPPDPVVAPPELEPPDPVVVPPELAVVPPEPVVIPPELCV